MSCKKFLNDDSVKMTLPVFFSLRPKRLEDSSAETRALHGHLSHVAKQTKTCHFDHKEKMMVTLLRIYVI